MNELLAKVREIVSKSSVPKYSVHYVEYVGYGEIPTAEVSVLITWADPLTYAAEEHTRQALEEAGLEHWDEDDGTDTFGVIKPLETLYV